MTIDNAKERLPSSFTKKYEMLELEKYLQGTFQKNLSLIFSSNYLALVVSFLLSQKKLLPQKFLTKHTKAFQETANQFLK